MPYTKYNKNNCLLAWIKRGIFMGVIISLALLTFLFWIGYKITGVFLKAFIWLIVLVPIALILWGLAIVCCCTLILIPVGIKLFLAGLRVLIPG